ncbi:MAG: hypothetical protein ABGZ17_11565 [Planctomycetaceae bacterium]|jgi:hypothetical protein
MTEREAFDKVSKVIPYFSGFRLEEHRVVAATIDRLNVENEQVLEYLSNLPHLRYLTLAFGEVSERALQDIDVLGTDPCWRDRWLRSCRVQ